MNSFFLVYIKWLKAVKVLATKKYKIQYWGNKKKNAVIKFPFVIMYIPNWYKTQEMCNKVILENSEM